MYGPLEDPHVAQSTEDFARQRGPTLHRDDLRPLGEGTCRYCGGTGVVEAAEPAGSAHHARLECRGCGRFLRWLPRPGQGRRPAIHRDPRAPLARLRGSPAQTRWAASIRAALIRAARALGDRDAVAIISAVTDASWFIANRGRAIGDLHWPKADHLEPGSLAEEGGNL